MADITQPPTSDDPIVRFTASLRDMHDRVSATDDLSPLTQAMLMLVRAILAFLATAPEPAITEPTPARPALRHAPAPRHAIRRRTRASRARRSTNRSHTRHIVRRVRHARGSHPTSPHQTMQTRAFAHRAPLLPDLPKTVA